MRSKPISQRVLPPSFSLGAELNKVGVVEGWNAVRDGFLVEEEREGLDVPDAADLAISSAHLLGRKSIWPGVQWICRLRTLCE